MATGVTQEKAPEIRETIGLAVRNVNDGITHSINKHNFAKISEALGHDPDARFQVGPPMLHPLFYDPTTQPHDVPMHVTGLTAMIALSHIMSPVERVAELEGMASILSRPSVDTVLAAAESTSAQSRVMRTHTVRRMIRQEIADSISREEHFGASEQHQELEQIRHRLNNEWGTNTALARAGIVAGVGILVARRYAGR